MFIECIHILSVIVFILFMVELWKWLLNTLYIWIASHHSLSVFTYVDFLKLFSIRPF
jgi:hypothetical protein